MLPVTEPTPEPQADKPPRSHRIRDISAIVAVVGLFVTLAFNTIGVWQQVDEAERQSEQASETRLYTQVGLLVQLNQFAAQMDRGLNETRVAELRCDPEPLFTLSDRDKKTLYAALDFYEEIAWLFNQDVVTLAAARRHWGPSMLDTHQLGSTFFPETAIERDFPELDRFASTWSETPSRLEPCE